MLSQKTLSAEAAVLADPATSTMLDAGIDIVLKPLSHAELADIRIRDNLFAVGRGEPPFVDYPAELVGDLSRRHARIFCEYGAAYIADLGSKNGTTVNGDDIRQKTRMLHDGDTVCFGRELSYRLQIGERMDAPRKTARLASLTLSPESGVPGLQPVVITQFPFLISKSDTVFSRYREQHPDQVNYLSRRHAHIFLKSGAPFIEDLGSTNGTFLNGKRLDERAMPLKNDDTLAFGGHHFVYRIGIEEAQLHADNTVTKFGKPMRPAENESQADKTTFVASADSFLNIFCVDPAPQPGEDDKQDPEQAASPERPAEGQRRPGKAGRLGTMLAEMRKALGDSPPQGAPRAGWSRSKVAAACAAALLAAGGTWLLMPGSEEQIRELMAEGNHAKAASVAAAALAGDAGNENLMALATEALMKTHVPAWLSALQSGQYDRADAVLARAESEAGPNEDARSLLRELRWVGRLERFVLGRGGLEAPIRLFADEEQIKTLLGQWDDDPGMHQRALARVASLVPEFKEPYALALSHLRKLQSDNAVYVAAIDRLKATIAEELRQDRPQALENVFNDYAEKYPRLIGVDALRQDLRRYVTMQGHARAQQLGPLVTLLAQGGFATPPFQAHAHALMNGGSLPPQALIAQYQKVMQAWKQGNARQAYVLLEQAPRGPWSDVAARQLAHKKNVAAQFSELQRARGGKDYEERLLGFYALLDSEEDTWYLRGIESDVKALTVRAGKRAEEMLTRAQALWRRYRDNGSIGGAQRLESGVSGQFRAQARLLTDANENAVKGTRLYKELKIEYPSQWDKLQADIAAEAELQRRSMMELQRVLDPGVVKAKLALLGGAER
ncbi:FHA domain-containing protein [Noviherbaspirillum sp. CPCC 100848]|uniref:FHA domain-containing protein n=1 Tax=Noviherbaspirillum album TaxID=3080276 RepID=A0ABU6JJ03_9BURK|nr:FHA domain-containing protein [Noviherbaspirillum sp. CPCC 100848]MEC4723683.1 FHA domain-containing protein [Noviherbaspirillum sp. CPCC 100848]